jgi:hypothetical protein
MVLHAINPMTATTITMTIVSTGLLTTLFVVQAKAFLAPAVTVSVVGIAIVTPFNFRYRESL